MKGDQTSLKYYLCWQAIHQQIDSLADLLDKQFPPFDHHPNSYFLYESDTSRESLADVLDQIRQAACSVVESKENGFDFCVIDRKNWQNVRYDPQVGLLLKDDDQLVRTKPTRNRVIKFITLIARISYLLRSNITQTKRKLYYADKDLHGKMQCSLDGLIDDLAATLRIPRVSLHILATDKGLFCGKIKLATAVCEEDSGLRTLNTFETDGLSASTLITNPFVIVGMESDAKFCLVVEKEAVFNDMVNSRVHIKFNCILVTGKGVPDISTRRFVNLIWQFLRIPIFCLVDGDARGLEIMCIYRFGAVNTAYDNEHLAAPQMKWIGILPTDLCDPKFKEAFECIDGGIVKYESEDEEVAQENSYGFINVHEKENERSQAFKAGLERLTERDVERLLGLLKREYVQQNPKIDEQLRKMLAIDVKAGLELLSEVGHNYIWDWYLPKKLAEGNFV